MKHHYRRLPQGTVKVPAYSKPVLLVGRESMNRAVHGDIVAVEIFPESEWKAPADAVVDQHSVYSGFLLAVKLNLAQLHCETTTLTIRTWKMQILENPQNINW